MKICSQIIVCFGIVIHCNISNIVHADIHYQFWISVCYNTHSHIHIEKLYLYHGSRYTFNLQIFKHIVLCY